MANADQTECLAGASISLVDFAKNMGHAGADSSVNAIRYEAFCFLFLGEYGANERRCATIYHTLRCGLVHDFSAQPDRSNATVQPLEIVFVRDNDPPDEDDSASPQVLIIGVQHFVTSVRVALGLWESASNQTAQQAFVDQWNMSELSASSSTGTIVPGASGGASALMTSGRSILARIRNI